MKLYEFSDKSVELAKALSTLGFDYVEKYATSVNNTKVIHLRALNAYTQCELNKAFFPELAIGDRVSVNYIQNFRVCNELYKKLNEENVII